MNEWGAFVANEITVGGKLYLQDTRELNSSVDQEAAASSFKAAASGAFSSFSASASYGHDKKTDNTKITVDQNRTVDLYAYGGEEAKVHNPPEWLASLGPSTEWKNCKITKLMPIYCLASDDAQRAIRNLMIDNRTRWEEAAFVVPYEDYIAPLERLAADVCE